MSRITLSFWICFTHIAINVLHDISLVPTLLFKLQWGHKSLRHPWLQHHQSWLDLRKFEMHIGERYTKVTMLLGNTHTHTTLCTQSTSIWLSTRWYGRKSLIMNELTSVRKDLSLWIDSLLHNVALCRLSSLRMQRHEDTWRYMIRNQRPQYCSSEWTGGTSGETE